MITLTNATSTLALPPDLDWPDEFSWSPIKTKVEPSITGSLIIDVGVLSAGRHFVRLGRVVRFPWTPELVSELLKATAEQQAPPRRVPLPVRHRHSPKGSQVNWDY